MPGSAVLCTIEGSRPILVEVQALVSAATFGNARRTANGLDQNRLALLLAVLDKRAGLNLATDDVFVNVAGGMSVDEPAADLAVVAAVASSLRNRPIPSDVVVFGEVGLAGEVRATTQAALRRARSRAARLHAMRRSRRQRLAAEDVPGGRRVVGVRTVAEAWRRSSNRTCRSRSYPLECPMHGFLLCRAIFVGVVVYSATVIRPLDGIRVLSATLGLGGRAADRGRRDAAARHGGDEPARRPARVRRRAVDRQTIGTALFWADTGNTKVRFLHGLIVVVLPYLGLVLGARKGEWLEPAKFVSLFRTPGRRSATAFSTPA